jgi:hypothetical protein
VKFYNFLRIYFRLLIQPVHILGVNTLFNKLAPHNLSLKKCDSLGEASCIIFSIFSKSDANIILLRFSLFS